MFATFTDTSKMPVPGTNIRTLRVQQGLSLKELARATGLNAGNLSKLETGRIGYSREVIDKIAAVLGVSPGVLFAEVDVVEAAALQMRRVPILHYDELKTWRGPDVEAEEEDRTMLHVDISSARFCFALRIQDQANAPVFVPGDDLIFDARRQPKFGEYVAALNEKSEICIGRFRGPGADAGPERQCEVIPLDPLFPSVLLASSAKAVVRGTLIEARRYFR